MHNIPPARTGCSTEMIEVGPRLDDEEHSANLKTTTLTAGDANADISAGERSEYVPPLPPNGGTTAWLQVLAGHLVVFNAWGNANSFGIFQAYYTTSLHLSPSAVSWIGSCQVFLIFLVGTLSGRYFDAGYYRHVLLSGCALELLAMLTTSFSTQYWQTFLAQGICQGLGDGLTFCPTIALVSTYFSTRKSIAISTAACGGATGGIIFPLIAQQLLPRIGFGWTVRVMGLVVLVNAIVIVTVVRPRLPPRRLGPIVEWAAFKEMPYLLFTVGMFFTFWATYFAYDYVRPHALDVLGVSQGTSFTLLLILNSVGIPGRLIPALIADRYLDPITVFIPVVFLAALCTYLWNAVTSLTTEVVWVIWFGSFGAGIQSLFPSTLAGLTRDLSKNGTRIGMAFTIISIPCLTGPPLAGKLVQDDNGHYLRAQIWGGSSLIIGCCFLIAARASSMGWAWKVEELHFGPQPSPLKRRGNEDTAVRSEGRIQHRGLAELLSGG